MTPGRMSSRGDDWVADTKARAQILEIAQRYTSLKRMGASWRGACPIHKGEGPNFSVNPSRNSFTCFVCEARGTVVDLVMQVEHLEFLPAVKRLAEWVGVTVPERPTPRLRSAADQQRYAQQAALTAAREDDVLAHLGLAGAAERFRLGMRRSATGLEITLPLGRGAPGTGLDLPSGWLRFRVDPDRGLVARPVLHAAEAEHLPEPLVASPQLRGGLHQDPVLLVEDPLDVVRLAGAGFETAIAHAVAPADDEEGSLLSPDQARYLASLGARVVVLAWPSRGDRAQRTARLRALHATEVVLVAAGLEPCWLRELPDALRQRTPTEDMMAALRAALASPEAVIDLFQVRCGQVAELLARRPAPLTLADAVGKLRPTIEAAARGGDRVLYHAYCAWAGWALGVPDATRLHALLHPPAPAGLADEAEVF